MRRKILSIKKKEGLSFVKVGRRFGMSTNTIYKWTKRIEPKVKRERKSKKVEIGVLREEVMKDPDLYQYERAKKFKVSQSTMWRELQRIGVTYKKNTKTSKKERRNTYVVSEEN
jgi:transposase